MSKNENENPEKNVGNEKLITNNRSSNIQKIQDRKKAIFNLPKASKLVNFLFVPLRQQFNIINVSIKVKISTYSACQSSGCKCTGFKINSDDHRRKDESSCRPENGELCNNQNCKHPFCKSYNYFFLLMKMIIIV